MAMKTQNRLNNFHVPLILILLQLFSLNLRSQELVTLYTPKNESFPATRLPYPGQEYIEMLEDEGDSLLQANPFWDATRIGPATSEYNCHGYAWHSSENATNFVIQSAVMKYWTGLQSYIQTSATSYGEKVFYDNGGHSAITTTSQDYVISKWGQLPLYRHKKTDCPYWPWTTSLIYYKLNPSMSGSSDLLCVNDQRTFNTDITNMPGATLTWTKGSFLDVIGESDTAQYTVKGTGNGNTGVNFTISTPTGFTWPSNKQFHVGPFSSSDYPISGPSSAQCNSYVYYSISDLPGRTTINWSWPPSWTYISGQNTLNLTLRTPRSGSGSVQVGVNNSCGQCGSYATKYTSVYGYCGYSLIIYPNPATDIINVTIKEPELSSSDVASSDEILSNDILKMNMDKLKVTISDNLGKVYKNLSKNSKSFEIPINDLNKGNYIVTVSDGSIAISAALIVE
jgi:PKD-like domain/Secretion system C-terminal sorting domain